MGRFLVRIALVVSALAISACFSACTHTDNKSAGLLDKLTIAYNAPPFSVLADIAQAQGYFRFEGLEVTPLFYSSGKAALDEVLEGKADFATVAETPIMFAIMKGQKISIIATIQSSNKNAAIVARKDRGISTPRDLKTKKIGVNLGTNGEFFMDAFLAIHGMVRQDVTVVDLKPEEIPKALVSGDIDAAAAWSPFLGQAQKGLGDKGVTLYDQDIYTETSSIVTTQENIRKNPASVTKLLRALVKAEEFVMQHPAEAQKIVADFRRMKQELVGELWAGNDFSVSLDQSLLLSLEDESQWAIKNGLTKATKIPNYLNYIYLDGLTAVKPKAVRIIR
jgi:NitT/TauT family transport system substrate-binding protein